MKCRQLDRQKDNVKRVHREGQGTVAAALRGGNLTGNVK